MDKRRVVNKLARIQALLENSRPVDYDAVAIVDRIRREVKYENWYDFNLKIDKILKS